MKCSSLIPPEVVILKTCEVRDLFPCEIPTKMDILNLPNVEKNWHTAHIILSSTSSFSRNNVSMQQYPPGNRPVKLTPICRKMKCNSTYDPMSLLLVDSAITHIFISFSCRMGTLTLLIHSGRDKMDAVSQTTFSCAFSWMKMYEFRLKFHWS